MQQVLTVLLAGLITENFVLVKFLGICPFLGVSNKRSSAVGMGISVTIVMVLATLVTWPIQTFILEPNYKYLQTLVFILVIAALVQILETILKKVMPSLYQALGVYLPLITTNCAVLGVTILNFDKELSFGLSIINAIGAGLGFLLAMVIFSGVRERIQDTSNPPKAFEGMPIALVSAAIVSLSFIGLGTAVTGILRSIFG